MTRSEQPGNGVDALLSKVFEGEPSLDTVARLAEEQRRLTELRLLHGIQPNDPLEVVMEKLRQGRQSESNRD